MTDTSSAKSARKRTSSKGRRSRSLGSLRSPRGARHPGRDAAPPGCPEGEARALASGRCKKTRAECRAGRIRNPATGRCITTKKCPQGTIRNPRTHRCKRVKHSLKSRTPTPAFVRPPSSHRSRSRTRSRARSRSQARTEKQPPEDVVVDVEPIQIGDMQGVEIVATEKIAPPAPKKRHARQKGMMHSGIIQRREVVLSNVHDAVTSSTTTPPLKKPTTPKKKSTTPEKEYVTITHTPEGYEVVGEYDLVTKSTTPKKKSTTPIIPKPVVEEKNNTSTTEDDAYAFFKWA